MNRLHCNNHQMNRITALVITLFLTSLSVPAYASIKSGSSCTLTQYNTDVRLKSGKTTYACTGAPNGYFWYPVGSGGSSAHVSNSKAAPQVISPFSYELGLPALSNFVIGGSSWVILLAPYRMPFVVNGRPITLREVADFIYNRSTYLRGGSPLTESQVKVSEQPGFGLGNLVSGLVNNAAAGYAIFYQIEQDGKKHGK